MDNSNASLDFHANDKKMAKRKPNQSIANLEKIPSNLFEFCRGNWVAEIKELFKNGTSVDMVEPNTGYTAVLIAAEKGYIDLLQLCVSLGADCDPRRADHGYSALQLAIMNGHTACVQYLIQSAFPTETLGSILNRPDKLGFYLTHYCSQRGHLECLKLIMRYGANICNVDNKKRTPLHTAAAEGQYAVVIHLLTFGVKDYINFIDENGNTALHLATLFNKEVIVNALLLYHADVNIRNTKGESAYDIAVNSKFNSCAELIMSFQIKSNANETYQNTDTNNVFTDMSCVVPPRKQQQTIKTDNENLSWKRYTFTDYPNPCAVFAIENPDTGRWVMYYTYRTVEGFFYFINQDDLNSQWEDPRSTTPFFFAPPNAYERPEVTQRKRELAEDNANLIQQIAELEHKYEEDMREIDDKYLKELSVKNKSILSLQKQIYEIKNSRSEQEQELTNKMEGLNTQRQELTRKIFELDSQLKEKSEDFNLVQKKREIETASKLAGRRSGKVKQRENIRVFCRVRPLLNYENDLGEANENLTTTVLNEHEIQLCKNNQEAHIFQFDHVFDMDASQTDVYEQCDPFIKESLKGHDVCIFAYGQTGSGKTYTMLGTEDNYGVNFQALNSLFRAISIRSEWLYSMKVSVLEIYNETLRDLLQSDDDLAYKVNMKTDRHNNVFLEGLVERDANSFAEVVMAMKEATDRRVVGFHKLNDKSSRSHLIMTVTLSGINRESKELVVTRLNLVDLAGSERAYKTHAEADRLKEAKDINKSLSALGDVINAFADKAKHVPYRNSKLTRVLQESLSGDGKVLMFVMISPSQYNYGESMSSLEFAQRCRACNS